MATTWSLFTKRAEMRGRRNALLPRRMKGDTMKAGWICATLMVVLIAGCATAGRYAGVQGGNGMYVWHENGQRWANCISGRAGT